MLGRLAKWLRILGVDCAYEHGLLDTEVLARAAAGKRILLTRDVALAKRAGPMGFRVRSGKVKEQVREVTVAFALPCQPVFDRCLACNVLVGPAAREAVTAGVPREIVRRGGPFTQCPVCERIYWPGSHRRRAGQWIEGITGTSARRP